MNLKNFTFLSLIASVALVSVSCDQLKDLTYNTTPNPLEMHGDSVAISVTVNIPPKGIKKGTATKREPQLVFCLKETTNKKIKKGTTTKREPPTKHMPHPQPTRDIVLTEGPHQQTRLTVPLNVTWRDLAAKYGEATGMQQITHIWFLVDMRPITPQQMDDQIPPDIDQAEIRFRILGGTSTTTRTVWITDTRDLHTPHNHMARPRGTIRTHHPVYQPQ
jgi:hypothetical protein